MPGPCATVGLRVSNPAIIVIIDAPPTAAHHPNTPCAAASTPNDAASLISPPPNPGISKYMYAHITPPRIHHGSATAAHPHATKIAGRVSTSGSLRKHVSIPARIMAHTTPAAKPKSHAPPRL